MTMVEPIHLLMFGSSSVVSHGEGVVKLDNWYVAVTNDMPTSMYVVQTHEYL